MAIIYGKAISIGYGSSKPSGGGGGLYSIWLTIPAVATSVTFTAVKGDVSVASTYISNIGAAKITLPETDYEGDWTVSGTVGGKTASQTVTVTSDKNDYFVDMRNDFIPLSGELKVGNLVTFDDKNWRVVHQEGTHWYLASENIVSQTAFGSNNTYKGSTLAGVAATYESEQLSATAKEYCVDVTVENVTSKVFVPTYDQVFTGGFEYYKTQANRITKWSGVAGSWWTSSAYYTGGYVCTVGADGASYSNIKPSGGGTLGFRPHICISYHPYSFDFAYTGIYNIREDGVVELLSSGNFITNNYLQLDIFCVGGGGAGGTHTYNNYSAGGGGAGGYTTTDKNRTINANQTYVVTIGAGGAVNTSSWGEGGNGGATSFGDITAKGGTGGAGYIGSESAGGGKNGGSGGGAGTRNSTSGGAGGTNGGNGGAGSDNSGGTGQGTTTREFGESNGKLYAGGGGGGRYSSSQAISAGGEGGGGNGGWCSSQSSYTLATAGQANTGGGGGGGSSTGGTTSTVSHRPGGAGGSGIVCLRLHKEEEPKEEMPLVGTLAVGNLVTYDNKSWRVVHNDGTKWYLASENCVKSTIFGTTSTYSGSTIASECTTYLTNNISALAQKFMVDVTVNGVTNKVFVPSRDQMITGGFSYYLSPESNKIATLNGSAVYWWTSSQYSSDNVYYVTTAGAISYYICNTSHGFRPHICIDTSLSGSATKTLSGTWTFNDTVNAPSTTLQQSINFTAYNKSMIYIKATPDPFTIVYGETASTNHVVYNTASKWNYSIAGLQKVTFTSEQEVSDEFYEWFTANATGGSEPVIPDNTITAGTWKFKDIPATINGASQINMSQIFTFQSKGYTFAKMSIKNGTILYHLSATVSTGDSAYIQSSHKWATDMQTIILPENQTVSEEFYTWFIANATKQ